MAALGFAGLYAEVDTQAMLRVPEQLPQQLAQLAHVKPLTAQQLQGYFAAMNAQPDPMTLRGLIRAHCHMDAESLARAMQSGVKSIDRTYRLRTYSACFVGSEAVRWLRNQFNCSSAIAVQLGQALLSLGLMHHVVHEHGFEDQDFFYRLDATDSSTGVQLGKFLGELRQSVPVQDRSYLGKVYPQCWVGSEAVDWLHAKKKLARHEAENLLNRLMSFGLIEHVLREHRVKDGKFFYRFV
ncbi:MAG: DEP domain-containing protein [Brachymonas sp.]